MKKETLLKEIATTGYNVGFGAKKHFATYDIACKAPNLITRFSFAMAVFSLIYDSISSKIISAVLIIIGYIGWELSKYDACKDQYNKAGQTLTDYYNKLRILYIEVKDTDDESKLSCLESEYQEILKNYTQISVSEQNLFSDWWAHYKFFYQQQIDWVDEQLRFSFIKDKIPSSLILVLLLIIISSVVLLIFNS